MDCISVYFVTEMPLEFYDRHIMTKYVAIADLKPDKWHF
jgi:hypothetical protein